MDESCVLNDLVLLKRFDLSPYANVYYSLQDASIDTFIKPSYPFRDQHLHIPVGSRGPSNLDLRRTTRLRSLRSGKTETRRPQHPTVRFS
jgi:hypothetical protein